MSEQVVKILSIDGGGVRGLIPALILKALSRELNNPHLYEHFDLVAGASTGALITLLLTAPEITHTHNTSRINLIVDLYEKESQFIFNNKWQFIKTMGQMVKPKYNNKYYSDLLTKYLNTTKLHDCLTNILVPAFDMITMQPYFFKHRPRYNHHKEDLNFYLKDVALAATAAPTYLPPVLTYPVDKSRSFCFIDGGIHANNPALCAYIEARKMHPEADRFIILSLGTGDIHRSYNYKEVNNWGVLGWVNPFKQVPLLSTFMYAQDGTADHMLKKLPDTTVYRFNPVIKGIPLDIDASDLKSIEALKEIAYQYIAENDHLIRQMAHILA